MSLHGLVHVNIHVYALGSFQTEQVEEAIPGLLSVKTWLDEPDLF